MHQNGVERVVINAPIHGLTLRMLKAAASAEKGEKQWRANDSQQGGCRKQPV